MIGRSIRTSTLAGVVLLAACTAASETATQDDAALKASEPVPITQGQADEAVNSFVAMLRTGDATQAGNYYAPDATFISARGKVESEAAIAGFWAEAVKGGAGKTLELHPLKFGASGDLAWQLSHFTGGITTPTGHVLAVYQRQADGSIKLVAQVSIPESAK
ncbi:MAG: nuclear transport factor 2 family protein [Longimicrobiales bacterium]